MVPGVLKSFDDMNQARSLAQDPAGAFRELGITGSDEDPNDEDHGGHEDPVLLTSPWSWGSWDSIFRIGQQLSCTEKPSNGVSYISGNLKRVVVTSCASISHAPPV